MYGLVNNPQKTIVIPNAKISQSVDIMNRIISNMSYQKMGVDNSMAEANIWVVTTKSHITGIVDSLIVATYTFKEVSNGVELTIEVGKGYGAISDELELQDCNNYIQEAIKVAINPNIKFEEKKVSKKKLIIIAIVAFIVFSALLM